MAVKASPPDGRDLREENDDDDDDDDDEERPHPPSKGTPNAIERPKKANTKP